MTRIVTTLTITGSDPSGDADVQADLKAMSTNGTYAMSVITTLTTQSTRGVTGMHVVSLDFVRPQLDTVLTDIRPGTMKIGMPATTELATLVAEYLPTLENTIPNPVVVTTSGDPPLEPDAWTEIRRLYTLVELITPSLSGVAVLLECERARSIEEMIEQAEALRELGVKHALVKDEHLDEDASDVFINEDGSLVLMGHRTATQDTHGTDCTLPSAIAALRPRRYIWVDAVKDAKAYLTEAIAHADSLDAGHGHGPTHHFHTIWPKEER